MYECSTTVLKVVYILSTGSTQYYTLVRASYYTLQSGTFFLKGLKSEECLVGTLAHEVFIMFFFY